MSTIRACPGNVGHCLTDQNWTCNRPPVDQKNVDMMMNLQAGAGRGKNHRNIIAMQERCNPMVVVRRQLLVRQCCCSCWMLVVKVCACLREAKIMEYRSKDYRTIARTIEKHKDTS